MLMRNWERGVRNENIQRSTFNAQHRTSEQLYANDEVLADGHHKGPGWTMNPGTDPGRRVTGGFYLDRINRINRIFQSGAGENQAGNPGESDRIQPDEGTKEGETNKKVLTEGNEGHEEVAGQPNGDGHADAELGTRSAE